MSPQQAGTDRSSELFGTLQVHGRDMALELFGAPEAPETGFGSGQPSLADTVVQVATSGGLARIFHQKDQKRPPCLA